MTVDISEDAYRILQQTVDSGRYPTVNAALNQSIDLLADFEKEQSEDYLQYVRESIEAGLADAAAGRTIPGEEFLIELRAMRR